MTAVPGWLRRRANGNPASAIYGTIVAAAAVAAEGAGGHDTATTLGAMVASLAVFWIAHAYTDALGRRVEGERFAGLLRQLLREEWPIVESGLPLAIVLLAGAGLGASVGVSATAALVAAVLELFGWAALACRRAGFGGLRAVGYVLGAGVLGVAVIALKYAIH